MIWSASNGSKPGLMTTGGPDRLRSAFMFISLILAMSLMFLSVAQAAKLRDGQDPAEFYSPSAYLTPSRLLDILTPGTVWCMEPQGDSCLFITEVTDSDGQNFTYNVIEKWDETTILSVSVEGYLNEKGALCEYTSGTFEDIRVTSLNGKKLKASRVEEIRAELETIWSDYVGIEYCYTYVITDPRETDLITQFVYEDGVYVDNPYPFFTDNSPGAAAYYTLRDY